MDKLRNQIRNIFDTAPFAVLAFDASGTVITSTRSWSGTSRTVALPFVGKSGLYQRSTHKLLVDERLRRASNGSSRRTSLSP